MKTTEKQTHTPGPWTPKFVFGGTVDAPYAMGFGIYATGKVRSVVLADIHDGSNKGMVVAPQYIHLDWAKEHYTPSEMEANARLIAAAPELHLALKSLLERYVGLVNSGDAGNWNPEDESPVKEARAALAKATGGAR